MIEGPKTRGEEILGDILTNPELLKAVPDLTISDFPLEERALFAEMLKQLEDGGEFDWLVLSQKAPGGQNYLQRIQTGLVMGKKPETFARDVRDLKKQKHQQNLFRLFEEQKKIVESSGGVVGFEIDKVQAEIDAIKALEKPVSIPALTASLALVEAEEVRWLWPNFIPLGRASMISGDPNVGKTWLALDMAARLSKGLPWPDGSPGHAPANIIYLTIEDNPADTLRPRIDSLGGDPSRIHILNPGNPDFVSFASEEGIAKLEAEIEQIKDVRLAVLDPVLDFSGGINPNAAEQVRTFLNPLIYMAERMNFALILVAHLNKAQSQSAIYRTGGSTSAWLGKCRAAFMIFRDLEEKKKRYVSAIKSNLAPADPPQLSFIPDSGRLLFEKVTEEVDVEEHLNPQRKDEREDSSSAVKWLREALKDGPVDSKEIRELAAEEAGIRKDALYRAKLKLGVVSTYEGFGKFKTATWALPEEEREIEKLPF
jgi:hypothetical protein